MGSQEWMKLSVDESGKVKMFVMELNSQKLGTINNELVNDCQQNWPFPVKQMNLDFCKKRLISFNLEKYQLTSDFLFSF